MIQRWMMRVVLTVTLSLVLVAPGHAQSTWAPIGPEWKGTPGMLGLSRGWLRDGVMLTTIDGGYLARTRDHGETWQRVAIPTEGGRDLAFWMLDGPTGRIALLARVFAGRGTQQGYHTTLYRSVDDGGHWEKVWMSMPGSQPALLSSPTFDVDGTLFVNVGASVVRSTDAGITWDDLGQAWTPGVSGVWSRIGAVALSPSFATDRTMVAHVRRYAANPSAIPPDLIRGLLISTDAGSSWRSLGVPASDGASYPYVETTTFSPSYAEDGTVFALASDEGIVRDGGAATRHLFRSTDRGQTWVAVKGPLATDVFMALSPAFPQDRTIVLASLLRANATEPDGRCTVERSTDAGVTWSAPSVIARFEPRRYRSSTHGICDPLVTAQGPEGIVALSGHHLSIDLGQTWQTLTPPEPVRLAHGALSPGFAQDGTIFLATEGSGIWAYGSRTKAAAGKIGCTVPLANELGRLYETKVWAWPRLGCPSEPPTPARLTLTPVSSGVREIWLSPDNGVRLTRAQSGPSTTPGVDDFWQSSAVRPEMTFPESPTSVVDGFVQRFETGRVLGLFDQTGALDAVAYLTGTDSGWYELDDWP